MIEKVVSGEIDRRGPCASSRHGGWHLRRGFCPKARAARQRAGRGFCISRAPCGLGENHGQGHSCYSPVFASSGKDCAAFGVNLPALDNYLDNFKTGLSSPISNVSHGNSFYYPCEGAKDISKFSFWLMSLRFCQFPFLRLVLKSKAPSELPDRAFDITISSYERMWE